MSWISNSSKSRGYPLVFGYPLSSRGGLRSFFDPNHVVIRKGKGVPTFEIPQFIRFRTSSFPENVVASATSVTVFAMLPR